MFTGLIEHIGTVRVIRSSGSGKVVSVDIGPLSGDAKIGDSIAINGVCLTVSRLSGVVADFDVSPESLSKSTTGELKSGDKVNLERAMLAGGRFGGHIVQGHVDGLGKIVGISQKGDFWEVSIEGGSEIMEHIIAKGSVSVNGISLTIASIEGGCFKMAIIPVTWSETNLYRMKIGDKVNLETDIIVKTISAQLRRMLGKGSESSGGGMSLSKLMELGF